ncbi:MAG: hypothetical protein ABJB17_07935 [Burkholderiales bacterium]
MTEHSTRSRSLRRNPGPNAFAPARADPHWAYRAALVAVLALLPFTACRAALYDEIQVYTDDINEPGEFGLELHVNTTPRGRSQPDYLGEAVPNRGWRATPEFSYGLTRDFEAGLYLPVSRERGDGARLAGAKLRLKWVPVHAQDHGGWFFGLNGELSRLQQRYSESRSGFELRTMLGWRDARWLVAINPVLGWDLSGGYRGRSPETGLSSKVARTLGASGFALGFEHYAGLGTLGGTLPSGQQSSTLYAVVDYGGHGWDLNFGVGRGLTSSSDTLSVKAIVGFPF